MPRNRFFFDSFVKCDTGCWEWVGAQTNSGYGKYYVNGRYWLAHRLSFWIATGRLSDNKLICHKCDNPKCVNPVHLFEGTYADNNQDCVLKGRHVPFHAKGEINTHNKLSEKDVVKIYDLRGSKKLKDIAAEYGVNTTTISHIWQQRTWKHLHENS